MPSLFTRIIEGELPARFVWQDHHCVAFLTIAPLRPGHVLVVPRQEVDHWLDADAPLMCHLMEVARTIGEALQEAYRPAKVGLMIAGLEVPHLHIHVLPIDGLADLDFANARTDVPDAEFDEAANLIRVTLDAKGR